MHATASQVALRGLGELRSDASTPVFGMNGKPVDVSPPAIPGGNHHSHDLSRSLRYEQRGWRILHQPLDVLAAIRCAGMSASGEFP